MRLTFIPFNPIHENKDRVRQLCLKSTAKRYEKEYSRIGERLYSGVYEQTMVATLAERAYGVNIGEQVSNLMSEQQISKVTKLCRQIYMCEL